VYLQVEFRSWDTYRKPVQPWLKNQNKLERNQRVLMAPSEEYVPSHIWGSWTLLGCVGQCQTVSLLWLLWQPLPAGDIPSS